MKSLQSDSVLLDTSEARRRARASGPMQSSRPERPPLATLDHRRVSVELSPLATVGLFTYEAVQRREHLGTPSTLVRAVRSRLRKRDFDVLAVFGRQTPPEHIVGTGIAPPTGLARLVCGMPGMRFEDGLEQLAATPPDELLEACEGCGAQAPPYAWSLFSSNPRRWLHGYVAALEHAWTEIKPLWRRSRPLLDREVERVEAAAARGASSELIAALHPRSTIMDGTWTLPAPDDPAFAPYLSQTPYRLAGRFTVSPVLNGATAVFSDGDGYASTLFYGMPGAWRVFDGELPPPASLEALIGPQRTAILRLLDAPAAAGRIAEALHMVPGGATYHLRSLEAAGLVVRTRRGRHVIVERTARGTALLALYADA